MQVSTGALIARDPFGPRSGGCILTVPRGSHRVWTTVVDVSDDGNPELRQAYLSVAITDAPAALLGSADELLAPPAPSFGAFTGTDHGLLAVHDASVEDSVLAAGADAVDRGLWAPDIEPGYANVPLDQASGANIVVCGSGWGDGGFQVLATYDRDGRPVAVHVDFGVIGNDPEVQPGLLRKLARRLGFGRRA